MSNPEFVSSIFKNKAKQWEGTGSVQRYVTDLGVEGVARELKLDPNFNAVCDFLRERGEFGLRMVIEQSIIPYVSIGLGVPLSGLLDFLLEASELACSERS